jgi:peptidoglycan-associated lipoprotein
MRHTVIVLVAVVTCLSACGSPPPKPSSGGDAESVGAQAAGDSQSKLAADTGPSPADNEIAGPQEGMLTKRLIYFDFDSAEIRGEGTDVVAAHARYLASHLDARVRLEGHTDERGSREYNIGLGERRAQSVRRALLLQGATAAQVSTVSYGEERPAVPGHDEAAWAKDRRVEIVYTTPGAAPPGQ